jgi:hypothetical protein
MEDLEIYQAIKRKMGLKVYLEVKKLEIEKFLRFTIKRNRPFFFRSSDASVCLTFDRANRLQDHRIMTVQGQKESILIFKSDLVLYNVFHLEITEVKTITVDPETQWIR